MMAMSEGIVIHDALRESDTRARAAPALAHGSQRRARRVDMLVAE